MAFDNPLLIIVLSSVYILVAFVHLSGFLWVRGYRNMFDYPVAGVWPLWALSYMFYYVKYKIVLKEKVLNYFGG